MIGALILFLDVINYLKPYIVNEDNWKFGIFYYNKDDKRLFPPKRNKFLGWTVNFANPYSILAMILVIILLILVGESLKDVNFFK